MMRLKMSKQNLTFKEGCEMYIQDCKSRNLREGTINHYRSSYKKMYDYFSPDMPLDEFTVDTFNDYVIYLKGYLTNDVSINAYLRDLIATLHFLMNSGYMPQMKLRSIKVDKPHKETYTDQELKELLRNPNVNKCTFVEYQSWVISCLLLPLKNKLFK